MNAEQIMHTMKHGNETLKIETGPNPKICTLSVSGRVEWKEASKLLKCEFITVKERRTDYTVLQSI